MSDTDIPDAHAHIPKHLQLGVDLDAIDGDTNPDAVLDPVTDPDAVDALWADATTVEQFAEDLAVISETWSEEDIVALRTAREA